MCQNVFIPKAGFLISSANSESDSTQGKVGDDMWNFSSQDKQSSGKPKILCSNGRAPQLTGRFAKGWWEWRIKSTRNF